MDSLASLMNACSSSTAPATACVTAAVFLLQRSPLVFRHVIQRHVLRCRGCHLHGKVMGEIAEVRRAGDEVRFAVDLDDGADAASTVDVGLDQAL